MPRYITTNLALNEPGENEWISLRYQGLLKIEKISSNSALAPLCRLSLIALKCSFLDL